MKLSSSHAELFDLAKSVRLKAYSPYSKVKVGAALRTTDGQVFTGCNVENSSFGATICAERTAVVKAASAGAREIREIVIVTDATPAWPPCGMCRQVLSEFMPPKGDLTIVLVNLQGEAKRTSLKKLLPEMFSPRHMKV